MIYYENVVDVILKKKKKKKLHETYYPQKVFLILLKIESYSMHI